MPDFYIRTSDREAEQMLKQLADEDMRSISMEIAWLIRQEWFRRYSKPIVTVENEGDHEA